MMALDELLITLAGDITPEASSADDGAEMHITGMALELPMEVQIAEGGRLLATLPRSRLATGFDPPAARLSLRLSRCPERQS